MIIKRCEETQVSNWKQKWYKQRKVGQMCVMRLDNIYPAQTEAVTATAIAVAVTVAVAVSKHRRNFLSFT